MPDAEVNSGLSLPFPSLLNRVSQAVSGASHPPSRMLGMSSSWLDQFTSKSAGGQSWSASIEARSTKRSQPLGKANGGALLDGENCRALISQNNAGLSAEEPFVNVETVARSTDTRRTQMFWPKARCWEPWLESGLRDRCSNDPRWCDLARA